MAPGADEDGEDAAARDDSALQPEAVQRIQAMSLYNGFFTPEQHIWTSLQNRVLSK